MTSTARGHEIPCLRENCARMNHVPSRPTVRGKSHG